MTPALRNLALVAAAVALVALFVSWRGGDDAPPSLATADAQREGDDAESKELRGQLDRLRAELRAESWARAAVEDDLARLRAELAEADSITSDATLPSAPTPAEMVESQAEAGNLGGGSRGLEPSDAAPDLQAAAAERPMFDAGMLVAAGMHPQDAEELRSVWEQFALERLYLVDQASREGWLYKPRFQGEVARLEHQMLDNVGEEGWDQLLYASGQPNRVIVRQVLDGSPAEIAGLQPGDVIMRYNDRRVFKTEWLQAATARGRPGNVVRLEVLRNGEPVTVDMERGPLGTLLRNSHEQPGAF